MDIRSVRKQFLGRNVKYACSYDLNLLANGRGLIAVAQGVRLDALLPRLVNPTAAPRFFHVLDQDDVEGVDARRHSCPVGVIDYAEESVIFHEDTSMAEIDGRLSLLTDDYASIEVRYSGALRLRQPAGSVLGVEDRGARNLEGNAWLVPIFSTKDTRYRWLDEHACIAFGTWTAGSPNKAGACPIATALDVYSTG